MFIDIDYSRRIQEAKLHLAKPNKQIITILHEKIKDTASIKLGSINELSFAIPFKIENENGRLVRNKHIDMIREKLLIRLTIGAYKEWFIIEEISESNESEDLLVVQAYSLPYELRTKNSPTFTRDEVYNAKEALEKMLEYTLWTVGEIDPIFNQMYRSFDIADNVKVLDAVIQASETYGALIEWDTHNRKIHFRDMKKHGKFRGLTVNYGRLLRTIRRTRTADEMITRLHVMGAEGLTIHSVNPTGMGYIEDFSFFIYPFKRDENRNVIESSYFMSDDLCHALLDHQEAVINLSPQIKLLQDELIIKQADLIDLEGQLMEKRLELENVLALLDLAKSTEDEDLIRQREQEKMWLEDEIFLLTQDLTVLKNSISGLESQIESLQKAISIEDTFSDELLDELKVFIHEDRWIDDRYTDPQELYEDGLKKFEEMRQPKVVIDVTIDNLLNIIEEQYYWDKLTLGDLIKVKYPQMDIEYMAKIIEINYDFENSEVSLVIANTNELLDDVEKLQQLISGSKTATSLIENNKYKWDKVNAIEKEVNSILQQEWDANKRKIIAGVNNSIEVGNRGILIKNPDLPNEMLIAQAGILALTQDGGETWKTAIKPDGIVAERLIGKIIAGQELIITNSAGSFTFDANGVQIDANAFIIRSTSGHQTVNLLDIWNNTSDLVNAIIDDNIVTAYEKKMLKQKWDEIKLLYDSIVVRLNGYYSDQGNSIPDVVVFHDKYLALYNYLFIEKQADEYPILDPNNMVNSTRIDRVVFDTRFAEYETAKIKVQEILDLRAKELAEEAYGVADEAKRNVEEIMDDVVWKIELHSSHGTTFRNGNISTIITAKVYRGKDDITDTLPKESFLWKKYDKDGNLDVQWTNQHIGVGNVIEVDEYDVYQKAIFQCDVDIPEQIV